VPRSTRHQDSAAATDLDDDLVELKAELPAQHVPGLVVDAMQVERRD
jgi:hypothetical protein